MNNMFLTRSHTNTQTFSALLKTNETYFQNSFVYQIHLTVPLNKNLISEKNLYSLKSFVRLLINGKQTHVTCNRKWFNLNFLGGFYRINITQPSPEALPEIHYHIICISQSEGLEEIIATDLLIRLKKIISNVEIKQFRGEPFSVDVIKNLEEESERINGKSGFHYFSEPVKSLPKNYLYWMFSVMHQPVKTFGMVYKMLHQPYLY